MLDVLAGHLPELEMAGLHTSVTLQWAAVSILESTKIVSSHCRNAVSGCSETTTVTTNSSPVPKVPQASSKTEEKEMKSLYLCGQAYFQTCAPTNVKKDKAEAKKCAEFEVHEARKVSALWIASVQAAQNVRQAVRNLRQFDSSKSQCSEVDPASSGSDLGSYVDLPDEVSIRARSRSGSPSGSEKGSFPRVYSRSPHLRGRRSYSHLRAKSLSASKATSDKGASSGSEKGSLRDLARTRSISPSRGVSTIVDDTKRSQIRPNAPIRARLHGCHSSSDSVQQAQSVRKLAHRHSSSRDSEPEKAQQRPAHHIRSRSSVPNPKKLFPAWPWQHKQMFLSPKNRRLMAATDTTLVPKKGWTMQPTDKSLFALMRQTDTVPRGNFPLSPLFVRRGYGERLAPRVGVSVLYIKCLVFSVAINKSAKSVFKMQNLLAQQQTR